MVILTAPNVHELYNTVDAALTAAQEQFGREIVPLLHENGSHTIFPSLAALWAASGDEAYIDHASCGLPFPDSGARRGRFPVHRLYNRLLVGRASRPTKKRAPNNNCRHFVSLPVFRKS